LQQPEPYQTVPNRNAMPSRIPLGTVAADPYTGGGS